MSWNLATFPKIYLGLKFCFPLNSNFELVFAVSALFNYQVLFFVYVFCCNNEYVPGNVSCIWVQSV